MDNVFYSLAVVWRFETVFLFRKRSWRGRSSSRWFCFRNWKRRRPNWSRCCSKPGRRENTWRLLWLRKCLLLNHLKYLFMTRRSPPSALDQPLRYVLPVVLLSRRFISKYCWLSFKSSCINSVLLLFCTLQLVPPPGEDEHTRRIREYQQRLLEQNRFVKAWRWTTSCD